MKRHIISLLITAALLLPSALGYSANDVYFRRINMNDGLSSSQINDIMVDSRGYVWMATQLGINRYDGFRFRVFYKNDLPGSLNSNDVLDIQEDRQGRMIVETAIGYCIYDALTETFSANAQDYLSQYGINAEPHNMYVDNDKNLWVTVSGKGLYRIDGATGHTEFLAYGRQLHRSEITSVRQMGKSIYVNFNDGFICSLNSDTRKVDWQSDFIVKNKELPTNKYTSFLTQDNNLWITSDKQTFICERKTGKWYSSVRQYFSENHYSVPFNDNIFVKGVIDDHVGNLWIATEHLGLLLIEPGSKEVRQFLYDKNNINSIPDNTVQSLYVDKAGALWIGSYKNGVAYCSLTQKKFGFAEIGDICTITQDAAGLLWCGSNDNGIITYDLATHDTRHYGMEETGLGMNTVVSSLTARDGSLWFGTYNGGMAHFEGGQWKVYRADGKSGLLNDNVWALCQLPDGRIAIGTLGSGVQLLDVKSGHYTNYSMANSKLPSDFINSLAVDKNGNLLIAHSEGFSFLNLKSGKIENVKSTKFTSKLFNQIYVDSRGLIWCATASGMNVYDPKTQQVDAIKPHSDVQSYVSCSVTEDYAHNMWIVCGHDVVRVEVQKNSDGTWDYTSTVFDNLDGLQERQFNYRSILTARNGEIIVGGQDGINIIPSQSIKKKQNDAMVLFTGLELFGRPVHVGEEYNKHVILDESIDVSRKLKLNYGENAFTIDLASNQIAIPQKARFIYRLKGFSDKWITTAEGQSSVTFTNLLPGSYTLEAKVLDRDGSVSNKTSELAITIKPPFYMSIWAMLLYIIILVAALWFGRKLMLRRQKEKFRMMQIEREAKRTKELEDIKLTFFTNVSHEFRTPLMLIISPIESLMKKETDKDKHRKLELVYRKAQRLLEMVTQILDFRKVEKNQEKLNLISADIIAYIRNIVNTFQAVGGKSTSLTFTTQVESLNMAFDAGKVRKIVDNLLSNAMKYTGENGKIDVILSLRLKGSDESLKEDMLVIRVADNGIGISDKDKKHIFERFYMVNKVSSPYGGTGVGLNLVHDYALLHGGDVTVEDNTDGGTVFSVLLPIRHDPSLTQLIEESLPQDTDEKEASEKVNDSGSETSTTKEQDDSETIKNKPCLLLVDDSTDFLEFMTEELSSKYYVRTAVNGRKALDSISEHQPDIILSDVMMPVMDGIELCHAVKENKATTHIPFIMLTARLAEEHQIEGMKSGADDYITKPFNMDLLYMRIDNLLKWHHSSDVPDKGKLLKPELKHIEITSRDKVFVDKATQYVDDNLSDSTINVEAMASNLGMSRVQLYKKLVSLTGSTPSEFIRQIRLRRAEQMLRESKMSVSEIAYSVGFNNPRYFSKYFKEMYGVMPSQYKK